MADSFTIDPKNISSVLTQNLSKYKATVGTEEVTLECAAGRVLAEDVAADRDTPALPRSVRDGYAVRTANSCAGALKLLENGHHFDAVITDLNMEKENIGLEVARELPPVLDLVAGDVEVGVRDDVAEALAPAQPVARGELESDGVAGYPFACRNTRSFAGKNWRSPPLPSRIRSGQNDFGPDSQPLRAVPLAPHPARRAAPTRAFPVCSSKGK